MRRRWVEQDVSLALLSSRIADFLRNAGFRTKMEKSAGNYEMLVIPQRASGIRETINVKIMGEPNDFVIDFSTGKRASFAFRLGQMTTLFGGGSLQLRGLKAREALERFERKFWAYAHDAVVRLATSPNREGFKEGI